jgi:hypothetical protein
MAWRETLLRLVGPGLMGGLTLGKWVEILRENHFAVAPSCLPRALAITSQSVQNSLFHWNDRRQLGTELDEIDVRPPLFVLGHWRNGTTHLHNLLTVFSEQLSGSVSIHVLDGRAAPFAGSGLFLTQATSDGQY